MAHDLVNALPSNLTQDEVEFLYNVEVLGLPARYEMVFYFASLAAFFWALVVALRMWRGRSGDRLSSGDLSDTQRIPPGGTPGYTLLSLRSGWQVNDHITVLATLENLLDEDYRVHGSGSNEPGFGATLGVKVTF